MGRLTLILFVLAAAMGFALLPVVSQGQEKPAPQEDEKKPDADGEDDEPKDPSEPLVNWHKISGSEVQIRWLVQSPYGQSMQIREGLALTFGKHSAHVITERNDKDAHVFLLQVGGAEGAKTPLPTTDKAFTLKIGEESFELFLAHDALERAFLVPATAWRFLPQNNRLLFIDANFNGRFDDELVDWVVWGDKGRYAFAYSQHIPLDDGLYYFSFAEEKGKPRLHYRRQAFLNDGGAKELQVALNRLRMDFGLFPTVSDEEWDQHCLAHAKYMEANDAFTHHEVRENKGYTARGHIAGMSSILAKGSMSPTHALFSLWDTPLHAFDIRSPNFSQAAYGFFKPYSVIRSQGMTHRPFAFGQSWSFPPNDAVNIPIEWPGKESPDPRADLKRGLGYPITFSTTWGVVNFTQEEALLGENSRKLDVVSRPRITDAHATLEAFVKDKWIEVEAQHTFDAKTAPAALANRGWVHHYMLPLEALRPNTLHRVTLRWKDQEAGDRSYLSCFTTGEALGGHQWETAQVYDPKRKTEKAKKPAK